MTDIEVMQQALEALRSSTNYRSGSAIQVEAVENLCEALEQPEPEPVVPPELEAHFRHLDALKQPEQEPVAWGLFEGDLYDMFFTQEEALDLADMKGTYADVRPLYTTPPVAQPQQEPVAVKHCVTFLMHGENMAFKIGNQQFTLDYQPSEPGEFEFMENCLIQALHHFTLSVQSTPPAAKPEQVVDCPRCGHVCSQRPWVGLTNEEFLEACELAERGNYLLAFQRIQIKLKERNT